ncbi:helix-turn-helix domain-containing protein [Paenibacillus sp. 79R4]|uniref:helix-turn-helix domain-containing protein n=1 Tax=Paenibacillus sp. 79R4 TaxID=2212847 RepID=UPI0021195AD2|nr:helix-turn-helix transcriptional regulator [Paenibacillus sp. 79R4]
MATFGQRLREIRTNNNLTQKQFAQMFKVSESAIGMYERDEREPPFKFTNEVADHFKVTTDYLHGRTDNPDPIKQSKIDEKEQAEFEAFINNPEYGIFFKDYLSAPEERREEMRKIWSILREKEKGRKPGDRQGDIR